MRRGTWRIWLVILPLATGIGLVVYILSGLSLWLGVGLAVLAGAAAAAAVWRRTPPAGRPLIKRRAMIGVVAGLLATGAYDLCRYLVVTVFGMSFWPFDIFTIFGGLLVGVNAPAPARTAAGVLFHAANGIGFSIAFVILVPRPGILSGLAWAAVLELCMITLYPTWLDLKALDELLSVSIVGHAAYGLVLGSIARRVVRP